jgi:hypothetical protein
MSVKQFISNSNIKMLWEVVSDEEIFKYLNRDVQENIYQLFLNNIQSFFDFEKTNSKSLIELNKKYILLFINHIKNTYSYQPNKIVIHNEPVKELITYEEIQNDRKNQFHKDYSKRQEEFKDYMNIKAPPVPEFADKDDDKPIKEMDKILKEMQVQRNYEIEQINRNFNSNLINNQVDNWLKPQETSFKNDKLIKPINDEPTKKTVSFNNIEQIKVFNNEDEEDNNIFSKLKKISNMEDKHAVINNFDENRISKLERNMDKLNEKMDKILELLNK